MTSTVSTIWLLSNNFGNILQYRDLFQIGTAEFKGDEGLARRTQFRKDVITRMSDSPWNSTIAQENNLEVRYINLTSHVNSNAFALHRLMFLLLIVISHLPWSRWASVQVWKAQIIVLYKACI